MTLPTEISVFGFQSSGTPSIIKEAVDIRLEMFPATLEARFLVCETNDDVAVIGADILRNHKLKVGLNTSSETLTIGMDVFRTKSSPRASVTEMERRERVGMEEYRREMSIAAGKTSWMRTSRRTTIPPGMTKKVECLIDGKRAPIGVHVLFSLWDDGGDDITIPSITYDKNYERYFVPILNMSDEPVIICRRFVIGEIKEVAVDAPTSPSSKYEPSENVVMLADILSVYNGQVERDDETLETETQTRNVNNVNTIGDRLNFQSKTLDGKTSEDYDAMAILRASLAWERRDRRLEPSSNLSQPTTKSQPATISQLSQPSNQNQQPQPSQPTHLNEDGPVLFSSIQGVPKVSNEVLDQFHRNGMEFDMERPVRLANVEVEDVEIDIDAERRKGEKCPFWPSKIEYLKKFKLDHIEGDELAQVESLLWDFRHVFYNEETPEQFREGIRCAPVTIPLMGVPKREKRRKMSESKLKHCKTHIDRLLKEGVIERVKDVAEIFASNTCIVLEERYVASEKRNILKSRLTLDLREINKFLAGSAWPLPNMQSFRRRCAAQNLRVFTNLDASSYFHQIRVADESKKSFGFFALDKVFQMGRLSQGASPAPGIAQYVAEKIFERCEQAHPFLDDVTTASTSTSVHLDVDLPKTLAHASFFNLLFKPSKADILRTSTRVLGFQLSEESQSLSPEKWEKIRNLEFPKDKKGMISQLAFFNFFNPVAPRLSEICGPLRDLAMPKTHFKPKQSDIDSHTAAKEHLLDEQIGAVRMPSSAVEDTVVLFTDSSRTSLSCVIAQMLYPISTDLSTPPDRKKLYLIGCWSEHVGERFLSTPIWLKELWSLAQACSDRKWAYFLSARPFWVITDSSVVAAWSNLALVSDSLARKIQHLQRFDYRILWAESRLQAADAFSRLESTSEGHGTYGRFMENRLYNSRGESISWKKLYSKETSEEIEKYFRKSRHQPLSRPLEEHEASDEPLEMPTDDTVLAATEDTFIVSTVTGRAAEMIMSSTKDDTALFGSDGIFSVLEGTRLRHLPFPVQKKHLPPCRRRTRRPREELSSIEAAPSMQPQAPEPCVECTRCIPMDFGTKVTTQEEVDSTSHCTCVCERNSSLNAATNEYLRSVTTIELDDGEALSGRNLVEGEGVDEPLQPMPPPTFSTDDLTAILEMQSEDQEIETVKRMIRENERPDKHESVLLPVNIQSFLRNRSNFALSPQNVLLRNWIGETGEVRPLLVVGSVAFDKLIEAVHSRGVPTTNNASAPPLPSSGMSHIGIRKSFQILSEFYFAFNGRRKVHQVITACEVCRMNNPPRGSRDRPGTQISVENNHKIEMDFCGPLHGFTARPKYILVCIDSHSRYLHAFVTSSTADTEVWRCVKLLRRSIGGYPKNIQFDNAICRRFSPTKALLESNGVRVTHGQAYISTSQAKVERAIGTLSVLVRKYRTVSPKATLQDLVDEAVFAINSSPHSSLPNGRSPRDVHFVNAPSGFANLEAFPPTTGLRLAPSLIEALKVAKEASRLTLRNDIVNALKRQAFRSATNHDSNLRPLDLALRKRTSFQSHSPRKLQYKLHLDAYIIVAKIATNNFRVESLMNGETSFLSGDCLVKVNGFSRESLARLCNAMTEIAEEGATSPIAPRYNLRRRQQPSIDDSQQPLRQQEQPLPPPPPSPPNTRARTRALRAARAIVNSEVAAAEPSLIELFNDTNIPHAISWNYHVFNPRVPTV